MWNSRPPSFPQKCEPSEVGPSNTLCELNQVELMYERARWRFTVTDGLSVYRMLSIVFSLMHLWFVHYSGFLLPKQPLANQFLVTL